MSNNDKKLAEAEAAREKERTQPYKDPRDQASSTVEEVADAPEKRRAAGDKEGAARVEALLSMLERAVDRIDKMDKEIQTLRKGQVEAPPPPTSKMKCSTCRQVLSICNGKHKYVMVAPRDRALWQNFQGITINGVKYVGGEMVAESQADTILAMVGRFEMRERRLFIPGGKVFSSMAELGGGATGGRPGSTPII